MLHHRHLLIGLCIGLIQGLYGQSQNEIPEPLPWCQVKSYWLATPKMKSGVDMRPKLAKLDAMPLHQCRAENGAVFCVLSALAIEHAFKTADYVALSEGYTLWSLSDEENKLGSQLIEKPDFQGLAFVWQAVDEYGVALEQEYPVSYAAEQKRLFAPSPDVMIKALGRAADTGPVVFTGDNSEKLLDQIIQTLNAGHPVIVGVLWPQADVMKDTYHLSDQSVTQRAKAHAVIVVGYECANGEKGTTTFIFRNSYGAKWGMSGYGLADYAYLKKHLKSAWGAVWE